MNTRPGGRLSTVPLLCAAADPTSCGEDGVPGSAPVLTRSAGSR